MNIYDEAKVITHEEARNTMMKIESNDAYYGELQKELKLMATYISQQEAKEERAKKVEELAGLYRNLAMETDVIERSKYWEIIDKLEEELK